MGFMRFIKALLIFAIIGTTAACAGLSQREQRVLSGSAIGTAAGVGTAAIVGGPLIVGGAIGAAAGAVGGLVVDEVQGR